MGQVYGRYLDRGGASVVFYVRQKYVEECRRGFRLYRLPTLGSPNASAPAEDWNDFDVTSSFDEVAASPPDLICITVSSTALRADGENGRPWLADLAEAAPKARFLFLQPGTSDGQFARKYVDADRIAWGMISIISYQAPLDDETRFEKPGLAYWLPPLSKNPISGAVADEFLGVFRQGGFPVAKAADVHKVSAVPSALLMSVLVSLESVGWSFDRLLRNDDDAFKQALRCTRQTARVAAATVDQSTPFWLNLLSPTLLRIGLRAALPFLPLPLETYFRYHFTKVGDQTRMFIDDYIADGERLGHRVDEVRRSRSMLEAVTSARLTDGDGSGDA